MRKVLLTLSKKHTILRILAPMKSEGIHLGTVVLVWCVQICAEIVFVICHLYIHEENNSLSRRFSIVDDSSNTRNYQLIIEDVNRKQHKI